LIAAAWAGLGVRTSREPLPSREIEKSVVLPKGWTELELDLARASARDAWGSDGRPVPLDAPWRTTRAAATVRYGLAPGWEVFGTLPLVVAEPTPDTPVQTGFSTVEVGSRVALERSEAPFHSVAVAVVGRLPLGFAGGDLDGGARVPLTTGTGDVQLQLAARRAWSGLRFEVGLTAMHRFAGDVRWVNGGAGGRVKPGDVATAGGEVLVQAGPLAFGPAIRAVARAAVRVDDGGILVPVRRSGGGSVDTGGRLLVHLTRGVELEARLAWVVVGEDRDFVRLDELHPARTRTGALAARVRW
jgi:hypothetical protein